MEEDVQGEGMRNVWRLDGSDDRELELEDREDLKVPHHTKKALDGKIRQAASC